MRWRASHRFDPAAAALADRHYTRQTPGSPQMMPSGRALVLVTEAGDAVWGSSWQVSADGTLWAVHAWPRAWVCSIFRNEGPALSSELVREAVAATRAAWGEPPEQGFVTFVDAAKVRRKRDPGRCFLRAGFRDVGRTATGKVALQLEPPGFPEAEPALGGASSLPGLEGRPFTARRQRASIGGRLEEL